MRAARTAARRLVAVVEGVHRARDLLARLVALAGHQQDVAGPGQRHRAPDRVAASGDLEHLGAVGDVGAACAACAGEHRGADRRRVLAARVVVGHHHDVGGGHRGRAHAGSLARVAVAAGTEHDEQPSAGLHLRAQRGQRGGHGVRRVRVVDDEQRVRTRGPGVVVRLDPLHAAGHPAGGGQAALDRVGLQPAGQQHHRGQRGVHHVEVAGQRAAQAQPVAVGDPLELERGAGAVRGAGGHPPVGGGSGVGRERRDRHAGPGRGPAGALVVDHDDGRAAVPGRQQQRLGGEVRLHVAVQARGGPG
ncbi:hypothetical protein GCM10025868_06760 [Angustibacter aerolatus]|uniref:Uncharacterized protein n=1 Tax=Angustibacter aerolatus TaxID=1162965 RepID=A0ABQ6JCX6_9ACTN|nr:hypothetical protein GCM10025868_06760 [Angustibacter aerolatus]